MDYCSEQNQKNPFRLLARRLVFPGLKIHYYGVADWFLISLFILPSYFGVRVIFFDLTAVRLFEVLLIYLIFKSYIKRKQFIELIKKCPNNLWIGMYMFVVVYTNVYRASINTIIYWVTNGVLVFYLVAYLIVYEYGIGGFLEKLQKYVWIICVISPMELIIGRSPFSFLDTLGKSGIASRFGSVRIMGNCTTPNGFAMFLMILLPLFCYDWKKNRIDLGKNKFLILLMAINILLTGSRLTVGTLILGLVLCFVFQSRRQFFQSLGTLLIAGVCLGALIYVFRETSFCKSILLTFFSAVDEVLGTEHAVLYGADTQGLYNSTYYRELLWKHTILGGWLNPWMGRGGGYNLAMYIEGYLIQSCDNFYVGQYIAYAWPGVISWLLMSVSFFANMIYVFVKKRNRLGWVLMVSFICYFISLWYLDQLQTFPYMMAMFALTYGVDMGKQGDRNCV